MKDYELVIGLEVHVELATKTKIFCTCGVEFGASPNTRCCPVCMGLPGALPTLNRHAVELAVRAGLAMGCRIMPDSSFDRKNYFYPDLPKAYQITQFYRPICRDGALEIDTTGGKRRIGITEIHLEEDAGKLIHDREGGTRIDFNRCGVPLIEIVSAPDLRSAEETVAYLKKLRSILRYAGVSECRMNEGALRCDVNLSVRPRGEKTMGTRTEMKNLNSFTYAAHAIEAEAKRQIEALERGKAILQETRRFNETNRTTESLRQKENAHDYRYFPEPDLLPIHLGKEEIEAIRESLPALPDERRARYVREYGLSDYDAEQLSSERMRAEYFEEAAKRTPYKKLLANLMISELSRLWDAEETECPVSPEHMAELITLWGEERINSSVVKKLLEEMWQKDQSPVSLAQARGWEQINDREMLMGLVKDNLKENTKILEDYRRGKTAAAKALIGKIMATSGGRANPVIVAELVHEALNETL